MSKYIQISRGSLSRFALLLVAMAWGSVAGAASVTLAIVEVDDSATPPVGKFVDVGVGKCANLAQGEYGCLRMESGDSGPLNFFFQGSAGWRYEWMEIREPFANWGDPVPITILNEFKEIPGGGNFFDANGRHQFTTPVRFFNFNDLNTPGNRFEIQYRVSVTDGSKSVIIHPIIENEG